MKAITCDRFSSTALLTIFFFLPELVLKSLGNLKCPFQGAGSQLQV